MNNELMFYAALCEEYGIDEESMELYAYNDMILNEENYNEYVKKCKRTGREPMTQEEYNAKKSRIKKGLLAGAAVAAAAGAAYGGHKYAQKQGYKGIGDMVSKKKVEREKEMAKARKEGELAGKRADKAAKKRAKANGPSFWEKVNPNSQYNKDRKELRALGAEYNKAVRKQAIQDATDRLDDKKAENERARTKRKHSYEREDTLSARQERIDDHESKAQWIKSHLPDPVEYSKEKPKNGGDSPYEKRYKEIVAQADNIFKESFDLYDLFTDSYNEDFSYDLDDLFI